LEAPLRGRKGRKALLVLEDGSSFSGYGFGATKKAAGEVVFSTGMVGYTEALTDPSYYGQILTLTYPLVGNYGVPKANSRAGTPPLCFESEGIKVRGLVLQNLCQSPSHWASSRTLHDWLLEEGVPGIYGIDTRQLTKKLREKGVMLGVLKICDEGEEPDAESLRKEAANVLDPNQTDLVRMVTVTHPITYQSRGRRVVVIDCGVKAGILRCLLKRGFKVTRVPYDFESGELAGLKPDLVIVSNGPGDPRLCAPTIKLVRSLIEMQIPVLGICLGNQIVALSLGASTYKLKYGHRSQNQPALDLETGRCYITTQNHGYAIGASSLERTELKVSFLNANDKTVEGVAHPKLPCLGVQFHPEASPGPQDVEFLFDKFLSFGGR